MTPQNTIHDGALSLKNISATGCKPERQVKAQGHDTVPVLTPVDGGLNAWGYFNKLIAACIMEAVVWGFPLSYGIFLDEYLKDPRIAAQTGAHTLLPLIGTLSNGLVYLTGPIITPYCHRIPHLVPYTLVGRSSDLCLQLGHSKLHPIILKREPLALLYNPHIFLPVGMHHSAFCRDIGMSTTTASIALSLLNGFAVVSPPIVGILSDRLNAWLLGIVSISAASLCIFVFWGLLAFNTVGIFVFVIAFGLAAGGWSTLWPRFMHPFGRDDVQLTNKLLGLCLFTRGLGNVLSTPLSTALQNASPPEFLRVSKRIGFVIGDGKYFGMIVFVGAVMVGWCRLDGFSVDIYAARG
ncbi:hypothetical protein DL96DRAFT_1682904 [Flagelloscypha sp. PMI_526]|nr:hypothetical protein DL96DRAFT_1682904 [Flagelloscypha sp. PMI_526]